MTTHIKILVDSTTGLKFTESPRWYNGKLWFIDIHDKRIKTVDLPGSVATVLELPFIPNGFGLTPEGRTLIVGETLGHRLTAFDIREDGSLSNRRVWAQLPPSVGPDGICLDAEGGVWCANPEGDDSVVRVRKGGEIADRIKVDTYAYAVMLGGPAKRSGSMRRITRRPRRCCRRSRKPSWPRRPSPPLVSPNRCRTTRAT